MPITSNVVATPAFAGSATSVSPADVSIAANASRLAIAIVTARRSGVPDVQSATLEGVNVTPQLGSSQGWFSSACLSSVFRLLAPASGAGQTFTGASATAETLLGAGGFVLDGVDQTNPITDVDQYEPTPVTGATSISMSRTLDSDVGGKVYGIAFYRLESGSPPTGVSGESLLAGASGDNGSGFGFYVFEKDSAGSSTTISPTITFATSDAAAGFVAFSVRPAGAGGKAARLLI